MKFSIINDGLVFGNSTIKSAISEKEIIIIDEIGLLELENGGWHESLLRINQTKDKTFIITIRDIYVKDIIEKYNLTDFFIFTINNENNTNDILQNILF